MEAFVAAARNHVADEDEPRTQHLRSL